LGETDVDSVMEDIRVNNETGGCKVLLLVCASTLVMCAILHHIHCCHATLISVLLVEVTAVQLNRTLSKALQKTNSSQLVFTVAQILTDKECWALRKCG